MVALRRHATWIAALAVLAGCGRLMGPAAEAPAAGGTRAAARAGKWWAVQLHAHSTYSDGKLDVAAMIAKAKAGGLDALAISDHETTAHWLDPAFTAERDLLLLRSQEAADGRGKNHMGLHGMSGMTPIPYGGSREDVIAQAVDRGATLILNHPMNKLIPWSPLKFDARFHAIEVWNSWYWTPLRNSEDPDVGARLQNDAAIAWWVKLLTDGTKVAPIAAADFHQAPQRLDAPCTLVWAPVKTQDAILAGIRAGRTLLTNGPRDARITLEADADGDGVYEAIVGDTTIRKARFRVRVTRGEGLTMRLTRGTETRLTKKVDAPDWTASVDGVGGLGAPFVYARLDGTLSTLRAMTAAIYLQ